MTRAGRPVTLLTHRLAPACRPDLAPGVRLIQTGRRHPLGDAVTAYHQRQLEEVGELLVALGHPLGTDAFAEPFDLFLVDAHPGEFLEILTVPFEEALRMIREGRITDAKSVCGLLWVRQFCASA